MEPELCQRDLLGRSPRGEQRAWSVFQPAGMFCVCAQDSSPPQATSPAASLQGSTQVRAGTSMEVGRAGKETLFVRMLSQ